MKQRSKRMLSLVLVLSMLLGIFAMTASADTTRTAKPHGSTATITVSYTDLPVPVDVTYTLNGETTTVILPGTITASQGDVITAEAVVINDVDYRITGWKAGDTVLSDTAELKYTCESDAELTVQVERIGQETLAKGAAVTASQLADSYKVSNLTDGLLCKFDGARPWGTPRIGTSTTFSEQFAIIDMGHVEVFNCFHLYPEYSEALATNRKIMNFPVSYTIYTSDDQSTWTPVYTVSGGAVPEKLNPSVVTLEEPVAARYVRLGVTGVNSGDSAGNVYIQMMELGVYLDTDLDEETAAAVNEKIAAAEAAMDEVTTSDLTADQIAAGTKFVSTAAMTALRNQVTEVKLAIGGEVTKEDALALADKLSTALATFQAAVQTGTLMTVSVAASDSAVPIQVNYTVNGESGSISQLPGTIQMNVGDKFTAEAVLLNPVDYAVSGWSINDTLVSETESLEYNVTGEFSAVVEIEDISLTNLALGKTATASQASSSLAPSNLTNGTLCFLTGGWWSSSPVGALSFSEVPVVIDLGAETEFNRFQMYPRRSSVNEAPKCFPKAYTFYISNDNSTWTPVYSTSSGTIPTAYEPAVVLLENPVTARYVKLGVTGINASDGTNCYVQMYEMGVYMDPSLVDENAVKTSVDYTDLPVPVDVTYTVNGETTTVILPGTITASKGDIITAEAVVINDVDYRITGWKAGDTVLSESAELTYTCESDATLTVQVEWIGLESLSTGAAVTASQISDDWKTSNLTDGLLCKFNGARPWGHPRIGTSTTFSEKYAIIDLGQVETFNCFHLYPEYSEALATNRKIMNFPVSYTIYTSDDQSTWTPVYTVSGGAVPEKLNPSVVALEKPVSARYVRLGVTGVNSGDSAGNVYIQMMELGVYLDSSLIEDVVTSVDYTDLPVPVDVTYTVNGETTTVILPGTIIAAPGDVITAEAVLINDVDYRITGWKAGDTVLSDNAALTYTCESDAALTVQVEWIGQESLAKGAAVTASQYSDNYKASNLTDGLLYKFNGARPWGSPMIGKSTTFSEQYAIIDLGQVEAFDCFRFYPEYSETPENPSTNRRIMNFPVSYTIYTSNDQSTWTPVYTVSGAAVPEKLNPSVVKLEAPVSARYIRLGVTGVNSGDSGGNVYIQMMELGVYCEASADEVKASAVTTLIKAIGEEITLDSKTAIEAARAGYDALTDEQKALVTNYAVLTAAEETLDELEYNAGVPKYTIDFDFNIVSDNQGFCFSMQDAKNFVMWQVSTYEDRAAGGDRVLLRPHFKVNGSWVAYPGGPGSVSAVDLTEAIGYTASELEGKVIHERIVVDGANVKTYFGPAGTTAETPTEELTLADDYTHTAELPFYGLGFRQSNDGENKSQEITQIDNLIAVDLMGNVLYRNDFSRDNPGFAASNGTAVVTEDGWLQVGASSAVSEQIYTMVEADSVSLSISGTRSVGIEEKNLVYTVSAANMIDLAAMVLTIEIDGGILSNPVAAGLNDWEVIAQTYAGGKLSVSLANPDGANGDADVLTITMTSAQTPGIASITMTDAEFHAYQGSELVAVEGTLAEASLLTRVWRNRYDVNADGVVNLLDLTRAQRWYGTDHAEADVDGSGKVDLSDLVLILNNFADLSDVTPATTDFVLYDGTYTAPVLMDAHYQEDDSISSRTYAQVARAVGDFRQDVAMVTGAIDCQVIQQTFDDSDELQAARLAAANQKGVPALLHDTEGASYETAVIVGVIGESELIDSIIAAGKLEEAEEIRGEWEAYVIKQVVQPIPGVEHALVIAGSDARGAIYGLYTISEQIGVSPYYWYSDVAVHVQNRIELDYTDALVDDGPDVKYRAIFINDEEISHVWAQKKFDEVTPGVSYYRRAYELTLRLKGNSLWPAMHPISTAFYGVTDSEGVPVNAKEANKYGVFIGNNHSTILLRSNEVEWSPWINANKSKYSSTAYDFTVNEAALMDYWRERLEAVKDFESILTIGLRGVNDTGIVCSNLSKYPGSTTMEQKVNLLIDVITKQREMIYEVYGTEPKNVPQMYIPYKEAGDIYNAGLNVFLAWDGSQDFNGDGVIDWRDDNSDIILLFTEDNQNYLRQTPTTTEQTRSGGSGVYYHASYCGAPRSYLVTNDVQLSTMESELRRGYDTGADAYWVLNVGDIKPGEVSMGFFMELAWDVDAYDNTNIASKYLYEMGKRDFHLSDADAEDFAAVMDEYYQLLGIKKPVFFFTANNVLNPFYKSTDDEIIHQFSLWANGDEAMAFIERCNAVMEELDALYAKLPEEDQIPFYQMVYFMADFLRNAAEEHIYYQKNQFAATQGRFGSTEMYAQLSQTASKRITASLSKFDTINNGKWDNMLRLYQNHLVSYEQISASKYAVLSSPADGVGAACENQETAGSGTLRFNSASPADQHYFDVFDKNSVEEGWIAETSADWITLSCTEGTVATEQRVLVSVNWSKVTADTEGTITVYNTDENGEKTDAVAVFTVEATVFAGYGSQVGYVAANGYAAIEAEHYTKAVEGKDGSYWTVLESNGQHESTMKALPSGDYHTEDWANTAQLHYNVYFEEAGTYSLTLNRLPTLSEGKTAEGVDRTTNIAVGVGSASPTTLVGWTYGEENAVVWRQNVLRQYEPLTCQITVEQGWNTIVVYRVDSDIVWDRMIIRMEDDAAPEGLYGPVESPNNIPGANTAPATPASLPTAYFASATVQEQGALTMTIPDVTAVSSSEQNVVTAKVTAENTVVLTGVRAGTATVAVTFEDQSVGTIRVTVTTAADGDGLYNEENGLLVIDAADAMTNGEYTYSTPASDGIHAWKYSGVGVQLLPDTVDDWKSTSWTELLSNAPSMTYGIMINNPGSYYFYANTTTPDSAGDSYHVFVDGQYWFTSNDVQCQQKWHTESGAFQLTAGKHTITVFNREDGLAIHQIALSTNGSLSLSGFQTPSETIPFVEEILMPALDDVDLEIGSGNRTIAVQAANSTGATVSLSVETSNSGVVTAVQSGSSIILTPVAEGEAVITVTASSGNCEPVSRSFQATVYPAGSLAWAYRPNQSGNIVINAVDAMQQTDYASYSNENQSGKYTSMTFSWVSVQETDETGTSLQLTPIGTSGSQTNWTVSDLPNVPSTTYTVWVPEDGDYYVSVFSNAPNDTSDSFFFGVNDAYQFTSKLVVSNPVTGGDSTYGEKWYNYDKVSVHLTEGFNTIHFWARESGFLMRQILLSPQKQSGLTDWLTACEAVTIYNDPTEKVALTKVDNLALTMGEEPAQVTITASTASGQTVSVSAVSDHPEIASVSVTGNVLTVTPVAEGDAVITVTASAQDCKTAETSFAVKVWDSSMVDTALYTVNGDVIEDGVLVPGFDNQTEHRWDHAGTTWKRYIGSSEGAYVGDFTIAVDMNSQFSGIGDGSIKKTSRIYFTDVDDPNNYWLFYLPYTVTESAGTALGDSSVSVTTTIPSDTVATDIIQNCDIQLLITRSGKTLTVEAVATGGAGTSFQGQVYTTTYVLDNVTTDVLQIAFTNRAFTGYTVYDIRSNGTLYTSEERVYDYTTDNGVVDGLLQARNLPDVMKLQDGTAVTVDNVDQWREETVQLLLDHVYGTIPDYTGREITYKVLETKDVDYVLFTKEGITGVTSTIEITVDCDKGDFTFTIVQILPVDAENCPMFVDVNFRENIPDHYLPVAQILKAGCGVIRLYYEDVASDSAAVDGIETMYNDGDYTWGKIGMWSFAAMRVMDYLQEQTFVDKTRIAVIGHSRLGKTALLTAALDTRFTHCCSNGSGTSGDALSRGNNCETVKMITTDYPYWFCDTYKQYADNESAMPIDQHHLLALIAPRKLAIGSSSYDPHEDPNGTYLAACAASPMWELYDKAGLIHPDSLPAIKDFYSEGNLEYHYRYGQHYLNEYDWACYISFLTK